GQVGQEVVHPFFLDGFGERSHGLLRRGLREMLTIGINAVAREELRSLSGNGDSADQNSADNGGETHVTSPLRSLTLPSRQYGVDDLILYHRDRRVTRCPLTRSGRVAGSRSGNARSASRSCNAALLSRVIFLLPSEEPIKSGGLKRFPAQLHQMTG